MKYFLLPILFVSHVALAGQVVSTPSQFPGAASEACDGRSVGADCMIEFAGGRVGFGLCALVPNGGGALMCQMDKSQLPADCQNNALGTKGSVLTFACLAVVLLLLRRRAQVT